MNEEVFDCVYNLWTGFVGKATCDAGFLKCDEMSCPAYTPRRERKLKTNYDRLISKTPEEMAKFLHDMTLISQEIGLSVEWWEQWLKSPVEVVDGAKMDGE